MLCSYAVEVIATDVSCKKCVVPSNISSNAVTSFKIKNGTIQSIDIKDSTIADVDIADGAVMRR